MKADMTFLMYIFLIGAIFLLTSVILDPVAGIFITCLVGGLTMKMVKNEGK